MPNYTYTDIDVAGSTEISPRKIDGSGDVVGFYEDAVGNEHGFVIRQGVVTTIDVPGAKSTSVTDINASGELVGTSNSNNQNTGYQAFTDIGGDLQTIVIPDSVNSSAGAINGAGQVIGNYTDTATNKQTGFFYADGQVTPISFEGATTFLTHINDRGQVSGFYEDSKNIEHAFIYSSGGFSSIAVPGSQLTTIEGVNDSGQVVGDYVDNNVNYCFVESDGIYTRFGVAGAIYQGTTGINDAGEVTGFYIDAAGKDHAFVEKGGVVTVIDDARHPNAAFNGINDAGEVVGTSDSNGIETLFTAVLTPPTIAGTTAGQQTTDRTPAAPFAAATVTDPNGTTDTLTISLSGGGGTLSGAGLTADADGTYTLTGSAAAVTQQLEALRFTPAGAGAPGSSNTTRFTLSDASDAGTTASDSTTTVVDTVSSAGTPTLGMGTTAPGSGIAVPTPGMGTTAPGSGIAAPTPGTGTPSPRPDAVTVASTARFKNGVFTLSGTASSAAGVSRVEITAALGDGTVKDLGAARVDANGNFDFSDRIGRRTQGFITATETDKAGGTASGTASYALAGGLDQDGVVAEQDGYTADGSAVTFVSRFGSDGVHTTDVMAPGQTLNADYTSTFDDGYRGGDTFVYDPGHGSNVVTEFRLRGAQHDTLSFAASDFGGDVAQVLGHSRDAKDGGGVVIRDPATGDTVQLAGVSRRELANNRGDIAFHA